MRGLRGKQNTYHYTLQRASQHTAQEARTASIAGTRIEKHRAPQSFTKQGSVALISATAILAGLVYFAASKSSVVPRASGPAKASSLVPSGVAEMQALFGIDQPFVIIEGKSSRAGESLQRADSGYEGNGIITATSPEVRVYGLGL